MSNSEGQASVIIIDPSRLTRTIVDVCLRREDVPSIGFADGASVLHAVQSDPELVPRAIVLELAFPSPGIDGYALIRLLRVCPRLDQAAIIVLSSRSGPASRLRARLAGADEYLAKPFVRDTFLAVISPYLSLRQAQAPPLDQDQGVHEARIRGDQHHESHMHPGPADTSTRRAS